jgi:CubicO group peptidase (beta-lactamase class C family)
LSALKVFVMRFKTFGLAVSYIGLVLVCGVPRAIAGGLAAQRAASAGIYYPPSESAGGWRRCRSDEDVRKLAGMDPQKLAQVGRVTEALYGGPWALVVIRHGYLAREWFGAPAMPQTTYDVWSSTKSATGIAYGLLFDASRHHQLPNNAQIDLDSKAYDFIPEGYPLTDPGKAQITIRQLLTMSSGIPGESHGLVGLQVTPGGGEFEIALGRQRDRLEASAAKLYTDPGKGWDYSDAAFAHLSLIFNHVTGQEIGDFMKARVFRPIGIENSSWDLEGGGGNIGPHTNAHSGLHLTARDFARLGYLLLHDGSWQGKQIVPKWWIELATKSSQSLNPSYGYTFWVNTDGKLWPGVPKDAFAFMGYATNRCYVVPSLDLVVVRLGYGPTPIAPVGIPLTSIVDTILK